MHTSNDEDCLDEERNSEEKSDIACSKREEETPSRCIDLKIIQAVKRNKRLERAVKPLGLLILLSLEIIVDRLNQDHRATNQESISQLHNGRSSAAQDLFRFIAPVAAELDTDSAAPVESPAVDALEEDDDDDEELDASATNEYPDGENDNDESYEDSDDDRQESRLYEQWIKPVVRSNQSGIGRIRWESLE